MNKGISIKRILIVLIIVIGIPVACFLGINVWNSWGEEPVAVGGIEGSRLGWKTFDKFKSEYTNFVFQYPSSWNVKEIRHPLMLIEGGLTAGKDSPLQAVILTPPDILKREASEYDEDQIVVYGGGMNNNCAYFRKKNPQTRCEIVGDLVLGTDPGTDYLLTQSIRPDILKVFDLLVKSIPEKHYSLDLSPETSTWKTYRNNDFGFEFKYPSNFVVDLKKQGIFKLEGSTHFGLLVYDPAREPSIGRGVTENGEVVREFDGIDISRYGILDNSESIVREGIGDRPNTVYEENSLIGSYKAAYMMSKASMYVLTTRSYDLQAILSTFRITKDEVPNEGVGN